MSNNLSDGAMKGATTGGLIDARFEPQGIVISVGVGGIFGFILSD